MSSNKFGMDPRAGVLRHVCHSRGRSQAWCVHGEGIRTGREGGEKVSAGVATGSKGARLGGRRRRQFNWTKGWGPFADVYQRGATRNISRFVSGEGWMLTVHGQVRTFLSQPHPPRRANRIILPKSRDWIRPNPFFSRWRQQQPDTEDPVLHHQKRPSNFLTVSRTIGNACRKEELRIRADPTLSGVKARRYVAHSLTQGTTTLSFPEVIHSSCPIHRLQVLQDPRHRPSTTHLSRRARRRRNPRGSSRLSPRPLPHRCPTGPRPRHRTRPPRATGLALTQARRPATMAPKATLRRQR